MATALYVATLLALVAVSFVYPAVVWGTAALAAVATALWYYVRLRDADLDRREGVRELDDL